MKKTYAARPQDIKKTWYIVDAKGKILGRLASKIAVILRGKNKVIFTPHVDTGDNVIVINAAGVRVTGRKKEQKVYRRYSGYPGGLREVTLEKMLARKPATVIKLAVRRMLPAGSLGADLLRNLKVYSADKHPHTAQKPVVLEV